MHPTSTVRRISIAALAAGALALALISSPAQARSARAAEDPMVIAPAPGTTAPVAGPGLIGHQGRWLTDANGRVMLVNGVNFVSKDNRTPEQRGFGADDAQFLADQGFDVVRLGLSPDAFMPLPGKVNTVYLRSFARTVKTLTDHGLLVLIDVHQDGWGPGTSGNGFPRWMTRTHGATNTRTPFPLYYITNPAIQAAFQSFWDNEKGPDGIGLQDQVATMWSALAGAVGSNPNVIGYDILNEPWPGTTWEPCVYGGPKGCPAQDAAGLDELHAKVAKAIRAKDQSHLIFGEPYVLFNFGQAGTSIRKPGDDARSGMAFHMYTAAPADEPNVLRNAVRWSNRTGGALLASEFGAVKTPTDIHRMVGEMDDALMPWIWWTYDENFIHDMAKPPTGDNVDHTVVDALVRPHAVAVAGTPSGHRYDPASRVLELSWKTLAPGNRRVVASAPTVIKIPKQVYGTGYTVKVTGGTVTSAADAPVLTVANAAGASSVTVTVTPAP